MSDEVRGAEATAPATEGVAGTGTAENAAGGGGSSFAKYLLNKALW